jgi:RND family efflux transporter MFP subunit
MTSRLHNHVAWRAKAGKTGFVLLLLASLGSLGCGPGDTTSGKKAGNKVALPPKNVRVTLVETIPMERTIRVVGTLAAWEETTVGLKVPGRLELVSVDLGTVIKKGQTIAQVELRDYELKLKQAEALLAQTRARLGLTLNGKDDQVEIENTSTVKQGRAVLDEATKNRDRVAKLQERGILAQSELETAVAGYEVAVSRYHDAIEEVRNRIAQLAQRRTEVEIARQQLTDSTIRAPFDGVIRQKFANAGDYLDIGARVAAIVRIDVLRLRMEVPERDAMDVRASQSVRLTVEGGTNTYFGEIQRLSPSFSELNRMLIVEADVKNTGSLRPGSFARAEIIVEKNQPATVVPNEALLTFAGIEKVFIVKEGKALEKNVSTGRRADGRIEIPREIKAGDTVVINPGNLQNGQPVIVETTSAGPKRKSDSSQKGKSKAASKTATEGP